MTTPDFGSIRTALTQAEDGVRESSQRRYHQGRTATPLEKIKVLDVAVIELCSALGELLDYVENHPALS
jgi:hypothetical protein